jgi:hypothetical protein
MQKIDGRRYEIDFLSSQPPFGEMLRFEDHLSG